MRLLEQNEINLIQRIVSFVRENETGFELLDVRGPLDFDRRALFEKLSTAGDRDLAIWILRIVLGLEVENYHSDTVGQLQDFIRKRNDSARFSELYSSVKGVIFTWGLAEQFVAVLVQYTEYNECPDYEGWSEALPNEEFAKFVSDLFDVTQGHIAPSLYCEEATAFIDASYEDYEYVGFDAFDAAVTHVSRSMAWIRDHFPLEHLESEALDLICRSAELLPYSSINLPGYPILDGIEGIYEFLLLCPEVALEYICRVNYTWPNRDIFADDLLYDFVSEISDHLSGDIENDLTRIKNHCNDEETENGACDLMEHFRE